jgi:hypothetical protein
LKTTKTDTDKLFPVAFWYFEAKLGIPFQAVSQIKSQKTDFPIPESILDLAHSLIVDLFPSPSMKSSGFYEDRKAMMKKINEAKISILDGKKIEQLEKFKNKFYAEINIVETKGKEIAMETENVCSKECDVEEVEQIDLSNSEENTEEDKENKEDPIPVDD